MSIEAVVVHRGEGCQAENLGGIARLAPIWQHPDSLYIQGVQKVALHT